MSRDSRKSSLTIGRRTKVDILAGKKIRKLEDGGDVFEDYWTDSEEESVHSVTDSETAQFINLSMNSHDTLSPGLSDFKECVSEPLSSNIKEKLRSFSNTTTMLDTPVSSTAFIKKGQASFPTKNSSKNMLDINKEVLNDISQFTVSKQGKNNKTSIMTSISSPLKNSEIFKSLEKTHVKSKSALEKEKIISSYDKYDTLVMQLINEGDESSNQISPEQIFTNLNNSDDNYHSKHSDLPLAQNLDVEHGNFLTNDETRIINNENKKNNKPDEISSLQQKKSPEKDDISENRKELSKNSSPHKLDEKTQTKLSSSLKSNEACLEEDENSSRESNILEINKETPRNVHSSNKHDSNSKRSKVKSNISTTFNKSDRYEQIQGSPRKNMHKNKKETSRNKSLNLPSNERSFTLNKSHIKLNYSLRSEKNKRISEGNVSEYHGPESSVKSTISNKKQKISMNKISENEEMDVSHTNNSQLQQPTMKDSILQLEYSHNSQNLSSEKSDLGGKRHSSDGNGKMQLKQLNSNNQHLVHSTKDVSFESECLNNSHDVHLPSEQHVNDKKKHSVSSKLSERQASAVKEVGQLNQFHNSQLEQSISNEFSSEQEQDTHNSGSITLSPEERKKHSHKSKNTKRKSNRKIISRSSLANSSNQVLSEKNIVSEQKQLLHNLDGDRLSLRNKGKQSIESKDMQRKTDSMKTTLKSNLLNSSNKLQQSSAKDISAEQEQHPRTLYGNVQSPTINNSAGRKSKAKSKAIRKELISGDNLPAEDISAEQEQHPHNLYGNVQSSTINNSAGRKSKAKSKAIRKKLISGDNLRRSARQRYLPLAHWRNERLRYRFEGGEIKVLGIDKGTKEDDAAVQQLLRKMCLQKIKEKITKIPNITVNDAKHKKKRHAKIYKPFHSASWDNPKSNEGGTVPYRIKRLFETRNTSFGYLEIKAFEKKPQQYMPDEDLHLTVIKGNIEVQVDETIFQPKYKDMLIIPRGIPYSIVNNNKTRALLLYSVGRFKFLENEK